MDGMSRSREAKFTLNITILIVLFAAGLVIGAIWIAVSKHEGRKAKTETKSEVEAPTPGPEKFESVAIGGGQNVAYVYSGSILDWAKANENAKIIHITNAGYYFAIVYSLE